MTETPVSDLSFEQALRALEDIVARLERGDVALEESITLYERGAELKKQCEARLNAAQMRVDAIRLSESGAPTGTEPFSA
jgi:exodeoxyribonuclease VII small subunit